MHLLRHVYVYDEATTDNRPNKATASRGIWFLKNWHIILPEDSTPTPKHAEETRLIYVLIRNGVFGWYN
jgi:hypothetical protein